MKNGQMQHLINETMTKMESGEVLEGIHHYVARAALNQLGIYYNRNEGWPITQNYEEFQDNLVAIAELLPEWLKPKQTFNVFYRADKSYEFDEKLTIEDVLNDFVYIKDIEVGGPEDVYFSMQGDNWDFANDTEETNVRKAGHMSMSVGDVVRDEDGKFWQVNYAGWDEIKPKHYWQKVIEGDIPFMGEPVPMPDDEGNGLAKGIDY